jgi:hypothetical protein
VRTWTNLLALIDDLLARGLDLPTVPAAPGAVVAESVVVDDARARRRRYVLGCGVLGLHGPNLAALHMADMARLHLSNTDRAIEAALSAAVAHRAVDVALASDLRPLGGRGAFRAIAMCLGARLRVLGPGILVVVVIGICERGSRRRTRQKK